MRTALTERFGITHPVMSAGMARVAQAPLVAAVSEAGGMGCLGGVSFFADDLRVEIETIRRTTSQPFAVNLLVPPSMVTEDVGTWGPVRARWHALSPVEFRADGGLIYFKTPEQAVVFEDFVRARRADGLDIDGPPDRSRSEEGEEVMEWRSPLG